MTPVEDAGDGIPWPPSREQLQKRIDELLEFAALILEDFWDQENGDVLQELGERFHLLEAVEASEPCDAELCACLEFAEFPLTCYRYTPKLQEALGRARKDVLQPPGGPAHDAPR